MSHRLRQLGETMSKQIYRFAGIELDTARRQLRVGDSAKEVPPQVFDTLEFLASHADQVVTKDDIANALWQGRVVTDASVSQAIRKARAALRDCGVDPELIRTRHGHGYSFAAEVRVVTAQAQTSATAETDDAAATPEWKKHPFRTGAVVAILGGILVTVANITEILSWVVPDDSAELLAETQLAIESTDAKVDELVQLLREQAAIAGNDLDPASESTIRDAITAIVSSADARKQAALSQLTSGDIDGAGSSLIAIAMDMDAASAQSTNAAAASWREAGAVFYTSNIDEAVRSYEAAFRLSPDDAVSGLDLAYAYVRAGRLDDALDRFDAVMSLNPAVAHRASAERGIGAVNKLRGNYETARVHFDNALLVAEPAALLREQGLVLTHLGAISREQGDNDAARRHYERAADIAAEIGDQHLLADALNGQGIVMVVTGEFDAAEEILRRVFQIHTERQDLTGQATALGNLGATALQQGDLDAAENWLLESVGLGERLGWQRSIAFDLVNLGGIAAGRDQFDLAAQHLARAHDIAVETDMGDLLPIILVNMGEVARDRGDSTLACRYWGEALPGLEAMEHGATEVVIGYQESLGCL